MRARFIAVELTPGMMVALKKDYMEETVLVAETQDAFASGSYLNSRLAA